MFVLKSTSQSKWMVNLGGRDSMIRSQILILTVLVLISNLVKTLLSTIVTLLSTKLTMELKQKCFISLHLARIKLTTLMLRIRL